jgi:hypothetical protein
LCRSFKSKAAALLSKKLFLPLINTLVRCGASRHRSETALPLWVQGYHLHHPSARSRERRAGAVGTG